MQPALCLTVPGLNGSGDEHWQTWAEREIPNCRRVDQHDLHAKNRFSALTKARRMTREAIQ
jgi:predicted alpha/beta hydrolase family esterase